MGQEVTLVEYACDQIAVEVLARRAKQAGVAQATKVNGFAPQNPAKAAEWLTAQQREQLKGAR
jgi:hypothetical protein